MTSTYTTNKNIEKPGHNDYVDDWDVPVNANMDVIDNCLGTTRTVNLTGQATYTLTDSDLQGVAIEFTGTLNSGSVAVKMPTGKSGEFTMTNSTSQTDSTSLLSLRFVSGGVTNYTLPQGLTQRCRANATSGVWSGSAPPFNSSYYPVNCGSIPQGTINNFALTLADCQNRLLVRFTSSMTNTTIVQVSIPAGLIGTWTVVNNATYTDAGNIQFGYAGSGYPIRSAQGKTQVMAADGSTLYMSTSA